MNIVKNYFNDHKEELDLFTLALTRAHIEAHPEVKNVRELYISIQRKLENNDDNLDYEFENLNGLTKNYEIPNDVCGTYERTYELLEKAQQLYDERRQL